MDFLGWEKVHADESMSGYQSDQGASLWFLDKDDKQVQNYDAIGVNHISIRTEKQADVDEVKNFLELKGTEMLFETPRHRPEFAASEEETYYQIIFESPDKILFEIVYVGKK